MREYLQVTLFSGQSFVWSPCPRQEAAFVGVVGDTAFRLWQDGNNLHYRRLNAKSCSSSQKCEEVLRLYLQYEISVQDLRRTFLADQHFSVVACSRPVRLLRLPTAFEAVLSFICSQHNNIPRCSLMVERICRTWGARIVLENGSTMHTIPTLQQLRRVPEEQYRSLGCGFRAPFLAATVSRLCLLDGENWLQLLRKLPLADARTALMALPGIGPKVADCICLFGLGFPAATPIDVHIWRVVRTTYRPEWDEDNLTPNRYLSAVSTLQTTWGPSAGWALMALYANCLTRFKEKKQHTPLAASDSTRPSGSARSGQSLKKHAREAPPAFVSRRKTAKT